jgi:ribosome maturation factor RimP
LDQITAVTKEISEVIETLEELGDSAFTLEVTSPGIDRPLTKPRHWRKNFDRLVKITMTSGKDIQGRIGEATETNVLVGDQKVSFEDIKRAVLEIEFK